MADPVWGLLSKAQDNPQTIDEAIAQAIAEHEADPEAHMGAGESIENHRTNEVIDHPAQSVVADKPAPFLSGALLFQEDGRGLSSWIKQVTGTDNEMNSVPFQINLHAENNTGTRVDAAIPFGGYNITFATEVAYLEFFANFSLSGGVNSWVAMGYGIIYGSGRGAGFYYKASDGHLYAFHNTSGTIHETDLGAPTADEFEKYRVTLENNEFNFYINGTLVATHSTSMPTGFIGSVITFGMVPHTGDSGDIAIRYFEYYQESGITNEP